MLYIRFSRAAKLAFQAEKIARALESLQSVSKIAKAPYTEEAPPTESRGRNDKPKRYQAIMGHSVGRQVRFALVRCFVAIGFLRLPLRAFARGRGEAQRRSVFAKHSVLHLPSGEVQIRLCEFGVGSGVQILSPAFPPSAYPHPKSKISASPQFFLRAFACGRGPGQSHMQSIFGVLSGLRFR